VYTRSWTVVDDATEELSPVSF